MSGPQTGAPKRPAPLRALGILGGGLSGGVEILAGIGAVAMVLVPLVDIVLARFFFRGLPSAIPLVEHAVILLTFTAAAMASRHGSHLSLAGASEEEEAAREDAGGLAGGLAKGDAPTTASGAGAAASAAPAKPRASAFSRLKAGLQVFARGVEGWIASAFFWASLSFVFIGFDPSQKVLVVPVRVLAAAIPLGFAFMAAYAVGRRGGRAARVAAAVGLLLGTLTALSSIVNLAGALSWSGGLAAALEAPATAVGTLLANGRLVLCLILGLSAIAGAPLFAVLGGMALVLLGGSGSYLELAPSEAYALLKGSSIPALPLFALAGFILAESGAGKRIVVLFREFFGPLPGGEAIAAVVACAFFTTFTGANGVTIIALGGLLAKVLEESGGYSPRFARGIITASGAIGLLLPPSAAVILYGVNASFIYGEGYFMDIAELFKGALVPGLVLIVSMSAMGVIEARRSGARPRKFAPRAAFGALKPAFLELLTPVIAAVLYFTGMAGLTEIGAVTVLYLVIVEGLVKRELGPKELVAAFRKSLPVLGGTLAILAAARALSFYLIDANVPALFTEWVSARAGSPLVFLLFLNLALLVVGCMMDIYSAILVVAPIVIPLGANFGLHPIHLGVVFIFNLCLGFLTPPVGMSLFLASYSFKRPLSSIYKEILPFLAVQAAALILITYVPGLTTFMLAK